MSGYIPIPESKSYLVDLYLFTGSKYLIENETSTLTEFMKLLSMESPSPFLSNILSNMYLILNEKGMKRVSHIYSLPLKVIRTLYMMNYLGNLDHISDEYKQRTKSLYECVPQKLTAEWKRLVIYLYAKKNFTHSGLSLLTGVRSKYFIKLCKKFRAGKFIAKDSICKTRRTKCLDEAYKKLCISDDSGQTSESNERQYRVN